MKSIILAVVMVFCLVGVSQAVLTDQEESIVRRLIEKVEQLENVANNVGLEQLPLQIQKLKKVREAKIVERDVKLNAVNVQAQKDKQAIMATYETQIDTIESQIKIKENKIESIQ